MLEYAGIKVYINVNKNIKEVIMDKNKIETAVTMILEAIGEDPTREGLVETPQRVARMYEEIFGGINQTAEKHLSKTFELVDKNMVIEKDIPFYSMCEHHLLPFWGKAHIAYIPNGRVAGLSKLARTVELYAKKPQLQERLTMEIADALMEFLSSEGALVVIEAEHMCMNMRGVKKPGTSTMTSVARGKFETDLNLKMKLID
ncbi:GTP cyclohydrolase I [Peptoniphilus indolicus ATCC 29427]|uniref:GTP cyclohydrolase 1 n=1 Tax=Peptoniphilus indolicus ATCC 29427 TaxID=997350 RepID=G4D6V9_9FIRM|nr:GTP cyclohydrolase I [Peptoniphilus indolicus ATCC 29427]